MQDTFLLIGRLALVAIFLDSGLDKLRNLGGVAGMLILAAVGPGRFSADGRLRVGRLAQAQG